MCKYCNYENRKKDNFQIQQNDYDISITINYVDMTEEIRFFDAETKKEKIMNINIPINNCPFCGRRLG